jgi:Domain of unknown function (DUF4249)
MNAFKNFNRLLITAFLISFFCVQSCVEPFKVTIKPEQTYLIIDGSVTDLDAPQPISVFETSADFTYRSTEFTATITPNLKDIVAVTGAKVEVLENDTKTIVLKELEPGYYQFPTGFKGKIGNNYKLKILKTDGKNYASNNEKLQAIPEIGTLYDVLNQKGIEDPRGENGRIQTIDIFVDFVDPPTEKNFYRWKWTLYEQQNICATCKQGIYQEKTPTDNTLDACVNDPTMPGANIFDYFCRTNCYDIIYGNNIEIFSDAFIDGQTQYDKRVAQVPFYQSNPGLLIVQQHAITSDAYRYYKLIQDQSINSGSIADTPPAALKGNVINQNDPLEIVLGYFTASSVYELKYALNKTSRTIGSYGGEKDGLFKYFNNRYPIPEFPNDKRSIIPFAQCKKNLFRTPTLPL